MYFWCSAAFWIRSAVGITSYFYVFCFKDDKVLYFGFSLLQQHLNQLSLHTLVIFPFQLIIDKEFYSIVLWMRYNLVGRLVKLHMRCTFRGSCFFGRVEIAELERHPLGISCSSWLCDLKIKQQSQMIVCLCSCSSNKVYGDIAWCALTHTHLGVYFPQIGYHRIVLRHDIPCAAIETTQFAL